MPNLKSLSFSFGIGLKNKYIQYFSFISETNEKNTYFE